MVLIASCVLSSATPKLSSLLANSLNHVKIHSFPYPSPFIIGEVWKTLYASLLSLCVFEITIQMSTARIQWKVPKIEFCSWNDKKETWCSCRWPKNSTGEWSFGQSRSWRSSRVRSHLFFFYILPFHILAYFSISAPTTKRTRSLRKIIASGFWCPDWNIETDVHFRNRSNDEDCQVNFLRCSGGILSSTHMLHCGGCRAEFIFGTQLLRRCGVGRHSKPIIVNWCCSPLLSTRLTMMMVIRGII